jgi:hypothetical protein
MQAPIRPDRQPVISAISQIKASLAAGCFPQGAIIYFAAKRDSQLGRFFPGQGDTGCHIAQCCGTCAITEKQKNCNIKELR